MDFQTLIDGITPEIYQRLKTAVELGKWANGVALTAEQRALSMQAVIAYETLHLPPEERSGYIPPKPAQACHHDGAEPIKWDRDPN